MRSPYFKLGCNVTLCEVAIPQSRQQLRAHMLQYTTIIARVANSNTECWTIHLYKGARYSAHRGTVAQSTMKRMRWAHKHVGESRAQQMNKHADIINMNPARSTMQQRSDNDATSQHVVSIRPAHFPCSNHMKMQIRTRNRFTNL